MTNKTYLVSVTKTSEMEIDYETARGYLGRVRGYTKTDLDSLDEEEVCELFVSWRINDGAITPEFETHISCVSELVEVALS